MKISTVLHVVSAIFVLSVAATAQADYTCPAGYSLSATTCTTSQPATLTRPIIPPWSQMIVEPTPYYTCPAGWSLSGQTCYYSIPATYVATPEPAPTPQAIVTCTGTPAINYPIFSGLDLSIIGDLRAGVDTRRADAGLPPVAWAPASEISVETMNQLKTATADVYNACGQSMPTIETNAISLETINAIAAAISAAK